MSSDVLKARHEFSLSKTNFLYLKMLATRCGIDLSEYKKNSLYSRLAKRLHELHLSDFDEYCNILRVDIDEEIKFINLITNSTTYFFRENHHFEYFSKKILPSLIAQQGKIRIWSAGCSTGEEPYSIAIVIHETIPNVDDYDIKILATDINSDALLKAQNGIFESDRMNKVNLIRQKIWFDKIKDPRGEVFFKINDKLKELITFNQLNLMDQWPIRNSFDVIFCRNVIIYFKSDISSIILRRFNKLLNPGGILILGHSENLREERRHYVNVGHTIYKKKSGLGV